MDDTQTTGRRKAVRRWTPAESQKLVQIVNEQSEKSCGQPVRWSLIAMHLPGRDAKQCRDHWSNTCKPQDRLAPWSEQEQLLLARLHAEHGNSWSKIAEFMPTRGQTCIKNFFNSYFRSKNLDVKANNTLKVYMLLLREGHERSMATYHKAVQLFETGRRVMVGNRLTLPVPPPDQLHGNTHASNRTTKTVPVPSLMPPRTSTGGNHTGTQQAFGTTSSSYSGAQSTESMVAEDDANVTTNQSVDHVAQRNVDDAVEHAPTKLDTHHDACLELYKALSLSGELSQEDSAQLALVMSSAQECLPAVLTSVHFKSLSSPDSSTHQHVDPFLDAARAGDPVDGVELQGLHTLQDITSKVRSVPFARTGGGNPPGQVLSLQSTQEVLLFALAAAASRRKASVNSSANLSSNKSVIGGGSNSSKMPHAHIGSVGLAAAVYPGSGMAVTDHVGLAVSRSHDMAARSSQSAPKPTALSAQSARHQHHQPAIQVNQDGSITTQPRHAPAEHTYVVGQGLVRMSDDSVHDASHIHSKDSMHCHAGYDGIDSSEQQNKRARYEEAQTDVPGCEQQRAWYKQTDVLDAQHTQDDSQTQRQADGRCTHHATEASVDAIHEHVANTALPGNVPPKQPHHSSHVLGVKPETQQPHAIQQVNNNMPRGGAGAPGGYPPAHGGAHDDDDETYTSTEGAALMPSPTGCVMPMNTSVAAGHGPPGARRYVVGYVPVYYSVDDGQQLQP